tara:strand:+ start:1199 stop:1441 length:243 start_codon:yes stop_codon:yes gene_type:complete
MGRKSKWELERDKQDALRKKAKKSLTQDQLVAIENTYKALDGVLLNIREIEDIYLSDIRKLDNCLWKLKHEFKLEDIKNG